LMISVKLVSGRLLRDFKIITKIQLNEGRILLFVKRLKTHRLLCIKIIYK
jgi:hypothetical protein